MQNEHRLENYLKNDLFEGIVGKMDYLTLYNADVLDKSNTVLISIHDPDRMIHPESKLQGFKDVSDKMTEKDLKEAKQRVIGLKKVTSEESVNVMSELLFSEISTGNAEEYYKYEEEINKVTLDQVRELAKVKDYSTAAIVPK